MTHRKTTENNRQHGPRPLARIYRFVRGAGIPLSRNDLRLLKLKNIHTGRRAFVIGNGPSLQVADLDRLTAEITFACNKIYLAFDATVWRPMYYSIYDVLVADNNREAILDVDANKIFRYSLRDRFREDPTIVFVRDRPSPDDGPEIVPGFSNNLLLGVYGGWTTIYFQLQLARWMGIREVILTGLDFHFENSPEIGEKTTTGAPILRQMDEINHFHPDYRKPGELWTVPELDRQREAFTVARSAFERNGGSLLNASRQTRLDVLERVDFDELVPAPASR